MTDINSPTLPLQGYTLGNLTPYTTYSLKVRAATIEGGEVLWGDFSVELDVTTSASGEGRCDCEIFDFCYRVCTLQVYTISLIKCMCLCTMYCRTVCESVRCTFVCLVFICHSCGVGSEFSLICLFENALKQNGILCWFAYFIKRAVPPK